MWRWTKFLLLAQKDLNSALPLVEHRLIGQWIHFRAEKNNHQQKLCIYSIKDNFDKFTQTCILRTISWTFVWFAYCETTNFYLGLISDVFMVLKKVNNSFSPKMLRTEHFNHEIKNLIPGK